MNELLFGYLLGAPGTGKTSLMRAYTARQGWVAAPVQPRGGVPHTLWVEPATGMVGAVELGLVRPMFGGTDALAMDVGPRAAAFVRARPHPLMLAEGMRLATRPFLGAVHAAGYRLVVLHLTAPPDVLARRCAQRGHQQASSWRLGAVTRAAHAADWAATQGWTVRRVDTAHTGPHQLAAQLARLLAADAPARVP